VRRQLPMLLGILAAVQIGLGMAVATVVLTNARVMAAPTTHSILVGPGYTDVSPHQLVRTAADRLYTVAPTCDSYPDCPNSSLRVYRADQPGSPASFSEQDSAHRPAGGIGSAAVAIDGTDTIHALWNDRSGKLDYATFATATDTWSATTLVGTTNWTNFGQGDEGVALALDANAMPHAVWSATGADGRLHLFYANKGGSWSPQQVDDVALTGNRRALHPTVAFTAANTLVVAWLEGTFNYTPDGIIRVRTRDVNGAWAATQTINDPDGAMTTIDNGPSLLVTPDGTIHLAFVAANPPDQVRYWYNGGGGWQGDRQPPAQVTHDPSLGPDGSGGVYLYGHGTPLPTYQDHGDDLYAFHKGAGAAGWGAWTQYATGAFDSSVTTRWAQFFQAHPEEVDIAYWADAYPNALYVGTDGTSGATSTPAPTATKTATPTSTATASAIATSTPTSTPIATPTNTPAPTTTPTPTATPTSTSTAQPTATRTPIPTNTPSPTPTGTTTGSLTLQVSAGGDDVAEDGTSYSATTNPEWVGTGGSTTASYLGLRFTNVALPKNAVVTSAKVQFYSAQGQWISMSVTVSADATGNSAAFSSGSKPSQRALTTAKATYADNTNWSANTWYTSSDLSAVVQEIVKRPDWNTNNSLSLILKGNGPAYGRKFVKGFEAGAATAPRLVITYR
jgi:hypothetical protein